jgi:hypothetical protein
MDIQGWAVPDFGGKAHLFRGGKALCGKWSSLGPFLPITTTGSYCCRECLRRMARKPRKGRGKKDAAETT